MPTDASGTYRHNDQSARMHSMKPETEKGPKLESDKELEGHEPIHDHLKAMHEATGHAHSHIEHHGDGTHTSHHIDEAGEVSGPHDHQNMDALKEHMDMVAGDGGKEDEFDQQEAEEPQHSALGM